MQVRLRDRFGDSGMIGVIISRAKTFRDWPAWEIDSWLMSCRVLGRKVEQAMLAELARSAIANGARALIGFYIPTAKNTIVKDHFLNFGFKLESNSDSGATVWSLDLSTYQPPELPMRIEYGFECSDSCGRAHSTGRTAYKVTRR
jgi:predicted enzyme involved in methoxymalonyl-ACP biosynthesis